jgi:hypothetical protein
LRGAEINLQLADKLGGDLLDDGAFVHAVRMFPLTGRGKHSIEIGK